MECSVQIHCAVSATQANLEFNLSKHFLFLDRLGLIALHASLLSTIPVSDISLSYLMEIVNLFYKNCWKQTLKL